MLELGSAITKEIYLSWLDSHNFPIVFVDFLPPNANNYAVIRSNHIEAGVLATEHLVQRGHRSIRCPSNPLTPIVEERYLGYSRELSRAGLSTLDKLP